MLVLLASGAGVAGIGGSEFTFVSSLVSMRSSSSGGESGMSEGEMLPLALEASKVGGVGLFGGELMADIILWRFLTMNSSDRQSGLLFTGPSSRIGRARLQLFESQSNRRNIPAFCFIQRGALFAPSGQASPAVRPRAQTRDLQR